MPLSHIIIIFKDADIYLEMNQLPLLSALADSWCSVKYSSNKRRPGAFENHFCLGWKGKGAGGIV